jgi:hypothetical protein
MKWSAFSFPIRTPNSALRNPKSAIEIDSPLVYPNMATHMKTTIDIADPLLRRAKHLARREGTTLKKITEAGLELLLAQRQHPPQKPTYTPIIVHGDGLTPEFQNASWAQLRTAIYAGHGA